MNSGPVSVEKFIHMMSLAWKQLWVYPEGHPARGGAVGRAYDLLRLLVSATGELKLGVDRNALICAGDRLTDTNAQQVAGQLFRRNVAVVRFDEAVRAADLELWLSLLHPDPMKEHKARLWDEAAEIGVRNIDMEPVDFSGVEATEDLDEVVDDVAAELTTQTLWEKILERLMEGGGGPTPRRSAKGGGRGDLGQVIELLRGLITEGEEGVEGGVVAAKDAASKQQIATKRRTRMSHLAEHLASAVTGHLVDDEGGEAPKEADLRQVGELVKALPSAMRPRVIDAAVRRLSGSSSTSVQGLKLMAASSSAASLVGSLRRLRGEAFEFSEHALSIVDSLAWQEAGGVSTEEELTEPQREAMAHELRRFFEAEDLDLMGAASDHQSLLLDLPQDVEPLAELPEEIDSDLRSLSDQFQTKTLSLTLLELIARAREAEAADPLISRLETVFATLVTEGQLASAMQVVNGLRAVSEGDEESEPARAAAVRALRRLSGPNGTAAVVDYVTRITPDLHERPQKLVALFDGAMARSLLSALSEEDDMTRRKRLLAFLVSLGDDISDLVVTALGDSRWFVVRNMLALLRDIGGVSAIPAVRRCLEHENPKVRIETVKTLAQLDNDPPKELIERALADQDPTVAEAATTMLAGISGVGVESLVSFLQKKDPLGRHRSQRLKAFRTLGSVGDVTVLRRLKRYFNNFFVFDHLAERRAAFASLSGYAAEARRPYLKKGRKSKDPEIQATCRRLWNEDQGGAN